MKSIDEIRDSLTKRQKYLFWRIIVVALLGLFGMDGLYTTVEIDRTVVLNTIALFAFPLLLEYNLGMSTYSGYTKLIRWIGFTISICMVIVCVIGYMGKIDIIYTDHSLLETIVVFENARISTVLLKTFTYAAMAVTIFDFVFTFNSRELYYLKAKSDVEKVIEENYRKYKEKVSPEKRKEFFKQEVVADLDANT